MRQYFLPWQEPLEWLSAIMQREVSVAFLHSSLQTGYSGRYSYLAWGALEEVCSDDVACLDGLRRETEGKLPRWFGHIAYEATPLPVVRDGVYAPTIRFYHYAHVIRWDHENVACIYEGYDVPTLSACNASKPVVPDVTHVTSHMPKTDYLVRVQAALEHIRAGNMYQANLTRKFTATLSESATPQHMVAWYRRLCVASPAPYSALLYRKGKGVLSSSPELFMRVDDDGNIETRPIKGTVASEMHADSLRESTKDRAENLMIVDLMRNDLSRIAQAGSVRVPDLYALDQFATVKHLSSTVQAKLLPDTKMSELLHATFPPGSMTGAPKCAAMEWIAKAEGLPRGIYSGAIGWIKGGQCELSVVIRTCIIRGNQCEWQVGGGIVADSDPEAEYEETLIKARGICRMLGIDIKNTK